MDKNLEQFISLTKHFNYEDYDFNVKWVKILFGLINQKIKFDKYEHTYTFIKNHKKYLKRNREKFEPENKIEFFVSNYSEE